MTEQDEPTEAAMLEHDHQYETVTDGDAGTPYYREWRVCWICGAPDDDDGEP